MSDRNPGLRFGYPDNRTLMALPALSSAVLVLEVRRDFLDLVVTPGMNLVVTPRMTCWPQIPDDDTAG
jgi:hypothetical protein